MISPMLYFVVGAALIAGVLFALKLARAKQDWPYVDTVFSAKPSLADVWADRGVSFCRDVVAVGTQQRVAEDDAGGTYLFDPASGRVTHVDRSGSERARWPRAGSWFAALVDAHARETWGPAWRDLGDPAIQMNPAELERLVATIRTLLPDVAPLRAETAADPERAVRWLFGDELPEPGVRDFFEHCEQVHDRNVEASLMETLSADEQVGDWVLVHTDEEKYSKGFWYWDRSRPGYVRVLVLVFDDHYRYVDHEFASFGELLAVRLRQRLRQFSSPYDLVTVAVAAGEPSPRAFPWDPPGRDPPFLSESSTWNGRLSPSAQILLEALPLFAPAVPIDWVSKVTDVSGCDVRHAVAELDAFGVARRQDLRGVEDLVSWATEALIVAAEVSNAGIKPSPGLSERWEAMIASAPDADMLRRVRRAARAVPPKPITPADE